MREDTSAPDQVQPPNVHWAQIVSDEEITVHVHTGKAIVEFIRALREAQILRQADPLSGSVLMLMLDLVNYEDYQRTRKLLCWPSRAYLAWHTGRGMGHISRAIRTLKRLGVVSVHEEGGGKTTTTWELVKPRSFTPCAPARRVPARPRAGGISAGAQGDCAPARRETARQRAPTLRAGAHQKQEDGNYKKETDSISNNNNTTTGGGTDEGVLPVDVGVVVVELEKQGIGKKVARELASSPTTTRVLAKAAALQAATRPTDNQRTGLLVKLLRNPDLIAQKYIDQAESKLVRPAPKPIEPGTPPDVETQKRGAQLLREALAKAKAGEA